MHDINHLIKVALNLGLSIINYMASGFQRCDDKIIEQRKVICDNCPQNKKDWCNICNCYIPIKITWKIQACPLGHWKAEEVPFIEPTPLTLIRSVDSSCSSCG